VRSVTDDTFEDDVLAPGKTVVVDFWAPWCGPCKALEPALEELAGSTDKVEFVKLDIDANPIAASRYDVLSIPTVMVFEGGEARATVIGARPESHFRKALADFI